MINIEPSSQTKAYQAAANLLYLLCTVLLLAMPAILIAAYRGAL